MSKRNADGEICSSSTPSTDPKFITYLFSPSRKFDCYFIVGNDKNTTPEKIGAVKVMLLAHSEMFESELLKSLIKEEGDVRVEDLYPDTFKNLLRYIYGYNNIWSLTFDEADNLLYAADKYLMTPLKEQLIVKLTSMLTAENICTLMNNPVCYNMLTLNNTITQCYFSVDSEDCEKLRKELEDPLKLIRLCTVQADDLCKEVASTSILTHSEFTSVCKSRGDGVKEESLNICNEVVPRATTSNILQTDLGHSPMFKMANKSSITLYTRQSIELMSVMFKATCCGSVTEPKYGTYNCIGTIEIIDKERSPAESIKVEFSECVKCFGSIRVNITSNGEPVKLLANCEYLITTSFNECHPCFMASTVSQTIHDAKGRKLDCQYTNKDFYFICAEISGWSFSASSSATSMSCFFDKLVYRCI